MYECRKEKVLMGRFHSGHGTWARPYGTNHFIFLLILFCTDLKTSEKRQAFFFPSRYVHYSGHFCVDVFWMRLTLKWEDFESSRLPSIMWVGLNQSVEDLNRTKDCPLLGKEEFCHQTAFGLVLQCQLFSGSPSHHHEKCSLIKEGGPL